MPFLLFGYVPGLRRMLPRPGKWMETFRRILAVPMGLTAIALLWLAWRLGGTWFALAAAALALLLVGLFINWRKPLPFIPPWLDRAFLVVMIAFLVVILPHQYEPTAASVEEGVLKAVPFSEPELAEARAANKPVFVWFTADWCLTCKVNESVAIEREATRKAFEKAGVVAMRGDWTRRDPAITRFLTAHGAAGVPLYLWYAPGKDGEVLPQVLTPDMLTELAGQS